MTSSLPYGAVLRRTPVQERSIARVESILDAAALLLRNKQPGDIGVRELADTARIPTGTVYQFFDDVNAVVQALAIRFLASMPDLLVTGDTDVETWTELIDSVVDRFAAMIRTHGAVRTLWLSGVLDEATLAVEREIDDDIATRIAAAVQDLSGTQAGSPAQWQVLVTVIDAVLRQAFGDDPHGDEDILVEAKRAAQAYTASILGLRELR